MTPSVLSISVSGMSCATLANFHVGQFPCGQFHNSFLHGWLTGKLIAVGVLDVLPSCLSSVYFFWDSDYAALAPGKFSALKEAQWVKEAARNCPALHYYYMGFYIHSCHKMQYKADYHPSDLLCPERFCWIPFDRVKAALDVRQACTRVRVCLCVFVFVSL